VDDEQRSDDAAPGDGATADGAVAGRARPCIRRGLLAVAAAVAVALAVGAFATVGPSAAKTDQRFVETTRTQGHVVPPGQQEVLLVTAARKICDRRENHSTAEARRQSALNIEEIAVVEQTFGDDTRSFTSLAVDTYCPR
jgi:Protein of unknown function (DUF732)